MQTKPLMSILIVDDLPANLDSLEAILTDKNYNVYRALSGESALKILLKKHIDLVLLDMCMPVMNGIETATEIRKYKKFVDMPIIFITAADHNDSTIQAAYQLDAIDFIFKPIDTNILLSKIGVFLSLLAKKDALITQENRQKEILKKHASKLSELMTEVEVAKNALDEFTYIASHDLREPLRGIYNYANFLHEDYADIIPPEGLKRLENIIELSKRQDTQIDALLEYSRIGKGEPVKKEFSMNNVLSDIRADLKDFLEKENADIIVRLPLPVLTGDQVVIGRVFYNLILNGIKYNKSEKKVIEVNYDPEEKLFSLKDNGIGISERDQQNVFKIFKRLHLSNQYSAGTGAGLTIVKKIIETTKGEIRIESTPDEGTAFLFTLPSCNAVLVDNENKLEKVVELTS